ncbi:sulfate permease [Rhodocaloribacter litoris]|uniref:SulP family inorganic anion transporter n=1 Tax=Rhodocaloribacter litoris TaxID=2558931 RepID=UPI001420C971|nr:sulfate permease [Rhodocaloribacter litoris]QXD16804.1 sulfate permease [Rhodocaloribacter litoris]
MSSLNLKKYLFCLTWLPGYGREDLRGDLVAGLTVGVMLVPQGMAYALLAGLPPIYGLYASFVPLLIYPIFGTSRHLAFGPIAIDMLIVAAGLGLIVAPGSPRYVELAILLAAMVGTLQLLMGIARLGFLVNLLSRPVITGFTAAAALIIACSQLGNLLGVSLPSSQHLHTLLWAALRHLADWHMPTLGLGAGAVLVIVLLQRRLPAVPGPLVAVVLGTLLAWGLRLDRNGVEVVGAIPTGLPGFQVPSFDLTAARLLLPTAVTLALVQFMNVVSLGKVFAAKHRYTIRPNRELVALGLANLGGSFFRSPPVSGSFSRTAVGAHAGTRTALANAVAALVIALTLLFLTPLFFYLPIPIFAAIIMVAALGLIDVNELRFLFRAKRIDGYIAVLTFLATLFIGIQEGVLIGVGASVAAVMYRISRPNVAELGHLPGTRSFRDLQRHPDARPIAGILLLRIDASFSFANAEYLRDLILARSEKDERIRAIVLDASSVNDLDLTAASVLRSVAETLQARGLELYLAGVKGPVMDVITRTGLDVLIGRDHFFLSPHRAVKHLLTRWGTSAGYLEAVPGEQTPSE